MMAPHPGISGEGALGAAYDWTPGAIPPDFWEALRRRVADIPVDLSALDAAKLIATFAEAFQRKADVTPWISGVQSRDAERRSAVVYFGCMDQFLGSTALNASTQLV